MVRDKRPTASSAWIPGVIVQQRGPLTFLVDVGQGQLWKRHLDHIKWSRTTAEDLAAPPLSWEPSPNTSSDNTTNQEPSITPDTSQ